MVQRVAQVHHQLTYHLQRLQSAERKPLRRYLLCIYKIQTTRRQHATVCGLYSLAPKIAKSAQCIYGSVFFKFGINFARGF